MIADPVTGPLTRDKLKELAEAPHGVATQTIRRFDPLWGRRPGEKFRWLVTATCEVRAYVEAADKEEAMRLACNLEDNEFGMDDFDEIEIVSVEADPR